MHPHMEQGPTVRSAQDSAATPVCWTFLAWRDLDADRAHGVDLTDEQRAKILECADQSRLEQWIDRSVVVTAADERFK